MSNSTRLPFTLEETRDRAFAMIGTDGIPNPWWPLATGNDCLAFILERMGLRTRDQIDPRHLISISAFRAWAGWNEVPASQIRPGMIAAERWENPHDPLPEHAEIVYAVDPLLHTVTTISANTSPAPGVPMTAENRGVAKKTRPMGDWLMFGIDPPYKSSTAHLTAASRKRARRISTWLNEVLPPDVPRSTTGDYRGVRGDGIEGIIYWIDVQTWGRSVGQYGETFTIDGTPGPRTRAVERLADERSRAALRK